MAVQETNLLIVQGATYTKVFTALDSDGDPIDLTDCDIRMQFRQHFDDEDSLYDASLTIGNIEVVVAAEGTYSLTIPATATDDFSFCNAVWDVLLEEDDGTITRIERGRVDVSLTATRGDI